MYLVFKNSNNTKGCLMKRKTIEFKYNFLALGASMEGSFTWLPFLKMRKLTQFVCPSSSALHPVPNRWALSQHCYRTPRFITFMFCSRNIVVCASSRALFLKLKTNNHHLSYSDCISCSLQRQVETLRKEHADKSLKSCCLKGNKSN